MDKKLKVIKTATKLFVKQGFEKTPTSQISKESNIATGTLFYYYKTKEELINAIYLHIKADMSNAMLKDLKSKKTKEQVQEIWTNLLKWGYDNKIENQFLQRFYNSTYINNLTKEQAQLSFKNVKLIFEKAEKEKLLKNLPPQTIASIVFSLYQTFETELYKEKKLNEQLIKQSFDIMWDAIKK